MCFKMADMRYCCIQESDTVKCRNSTAIHYSLVEKHRQHHLVGLLRQVGQEEDVMRRLLRDGGRAGSGRDGRGRWKNNIILI